MIFFSLSLQSSFLSSFHIVITSIFFIFLCSYFALIHLPYSRCLFSYILFLFSLSLSFGLYLCFISCSIFFLSCCCCCFLGVSLSLLYILFHFLLQLPFISLSLLSSVSSVCFFLCRHFPNSTVTRFQYLFTLLYLIPLISLFFYLLSPLLKSPINHVRNISTPTTFAHNFVPYFVHYFVTFSSLSFLRTLPLTSNHISKISTPTTSTHNFVSYFVHNFDTFSPLSFFRTPPSTFSIIIKISLPQIHLLRVAS